MWSVDSQLSFIDAWRWLTLTRTIVLNLITRSLERSPGHEKGTAVSMTRDQAMVHHCTYALFEPLAVRRISLDISLLVSGHVWSAVYVDRWQDQWHNWTAWYGVARQMYSDWRPGHLWLWDLWEQQFWTALHQLLQREASTAFHRAGAETRARGISTRRNPVGRGEI